MGIWLGPRQGTLVLSRGASSSTMLALLQLLAPLYLFLGSVIFTKDSLRHFSLCNLPTGLLKAGHIFSLSLELSINFPASVWHGLLRLHTSGHFVSPP